MCYNSTISFVFGSMGVITNFYILHYNAAMKKTGIQYILIFYTLMEFLQGVQYYFINQCSNLWNIYLTEIAYVLVILQPLIWNFYYYVNSKVLDKNIFITAIWMSVTWMIVNILTRILYDKDKDPQTQQNSIFASDKVCTKKKLTHLYWEWTSANFYDFNANFLTYLMLWFIPALISKAYRNWSVILICSALLAAYSSYITKETFVFTSLWCYISVPTVLAVLIALNKK